MAVFTARDIRTTGRFYPPGSSFGNETIVVTERTPLTEVVTRYLAWVRSIPANSGAISGVRVLCVIAHGRQNGCELGYGIQFGADDLTIKSVAKLAPLRGSVDEIELRVCGGAAGARNRAVSNGNLFDNDRTCRDLVRMTGAVIRASPDWQSYENFPPAAATWYGRVFRYDPPDARPREDGIYPPAIVMCEPTNQS